ncbi:MAG TPA: hypothetical protein VEA81_00890 [Burkholderiaceae bacterium]|nr:hypothetical protein [Burkholderiaceae bacterium]
MKNPFSRSGRDAPPDQDPLAAARREREREENERFMHQLYAGAPPQRPDLGDSRSRGGDPSLGLHAGAGFDGGLGDASGPNRTPRPGMAHPDPMAAAAMRRGAMPTAAASSQTADAPLAAVELLDIAHRLLEGRDDVESRVTRMLVGRALDLMRGAPES